MKKKSKTAVAKQPAVNLASEPTCEYTCTNGQWKLSGMTGGSDYSCAPYLPGICTNGSQTSVPASYNGGSRSSSSEKPKKPFPKNSGEYVFYKGDKSIRLIQGNCEKGRFLQSEISLKSLAKIDAAAADFLKMAAKQKLTSLRIVVAAQKLAKKK